MREEDVPAGEFKFSFPHTGPVALRLRALSQLPWRAADAPLVPIPAAAECALELYKLDAALAEPAVVECDRIVLPVGSLR